MTPYQQFNVLDPEHAQHILTFDTEADLMEYLSGR